MKNDKPSKYSKKEVEELITKLKSEGKTKSEIGGILKKQGIKAKTVLKKRISKLLKERGVKEFPEDLLALIKKAVTLIKHLEINKKDKAAKRGYQITVSRIKKLSDYYKKNGLLPKDWKYSEETAELLVK